MNSRQAFEAEIARLKTARQATTSQYLRRDYAKAIRRKNKQLKEYNRHQQEAKT